jgi:hypothetical protein
MINRLILSLVALLIVGCSAEDEHYYRVHPQILQKELKACPNAHPANITCTELKNIAKDINTLAYELQMNPQEFGSKILNLQLALETTPTQATSSSKSHSINEMRQELDMRLAIVKWLESPEN